MCKLRAAAEDNRRPFGILGYWGVSDGKHGRSAENAVTIGPHNGYIAYLDSEQCHVRALEQVLCQSRLDPACYFETVSLTLSSDYYTRPSM